jgi:hypothetical protein
LQNQTHSPMAFAAALFARVHPRLAQTFGLLLYLPVWP